MIERSLTYVLHAYNVKFEPKRPLLKIICKKILEDNSRITFGREEFRIFKLSVCFVAN